MDAWFPWCCRPCPSPLCGNIPLPRRIRCVIAGVDPWTGVNGDFVLDTSHPREGTYTNASFGPLGGLWCLKVRWGNPVWGYCLVSRPPPVTWTAWKNDTCSRYYWLENPIHLHGLPTPPPSPLPPIVPTASIFGVYLALSGLLPTAGVTVGFHASYSQSVYYPGLGYIPPLEGPRYINGWNEVFRDTAMTVLPEEWDNYPVPLISGTGTCFLSAL